MVMTISNIQDHINFGLTSNAWISCLLYTGDSKVEAEATYLWAESNRKSKTIVPLKNTNVEFLIKSVTLTEDPYKVIVKGIVIL